jgi:dTDP-glucose pyrophosphorylase
MNSKKLPLINESAPILDAIRILDQTKLQIALVERNHTLVGTITDGDIRRGILAGVTLDQAVTTVMNPSPVTARVGISAEAAIGIMRRNSIHQLPILDEQNRVIDIQLIEDLTYAADSDNWVVLMAGGSGIRLRPLTNDLPKPLLRVGDKPILQTILGNFISAGFGKFYIAVNYKAEMIEDFFGNGSRWGVDIQYLREDAPLGTAGALRLLPTRPDKPFFVMNGDLLTTVNFQQMLKYHHEHQAAATVCVLEHTVTIPYGVVDLAEQDIVGLQEKPDIKRFISAGVYLLDPSVFDLIGRSESLDMPTLINRLLAKNSRIVAFPLREYWIDIGRLDDLQRASDEYQKVFGL